MAPLRRFVSSLFPSLFSRRSTAPRQLRGAEQVLGYVFADPHLLELALSHRSHVRATDTGGPSNERLEFLGDSILGMVIARALYEDFPGYGEGNLTKAKSSLVNEVALAGVGRRSGLNQFILLAPEEERAGGRERASIVADAVEAVIAAVYLDGGYFEARRVILDLIYRHRDQLLTDTAQRNFKGELLELTQSRGAGTPRYDVLREEGPDHDKIFHVAVLIAGVNQAEASGSSKKEAEQRAAAVALERLQSSEPSA